MNEREKEFARLLVGGMKRGDAYRQAFNRPDLDAVTASKYASRVVKKSEVSRKMVKLNERLDRAVVASKQERMEALSEEMRVCKQEHKVRDMVACIAELNKMDGAYEPEKVEMRGQLGVSEVVAVLSAKGSRPPVH